MLSRVSTTLASRLLLAQKVHVHSWCSSCHKSMHVRSQYGARLMSTAPKQHFKNFSYVHCGIVSVQNHFSEIFYTTTGSTTSQIAQKQVHTGNHCAMLSSEQMYIATRMQTGKSSSLVCTGTVLSDCTVVWYW